MSIALPSRAYRLLRRVLPRKLAAKWLLSAAWLTHRLAWEQTFYWLNPAEGMAICRPEAVALVTRSVRPGDRVIDIGGGHGFFSKLAAECGATVLCADASEINLAVGREWCRDTPGVRFAEGDAVAIAEAHGPFDVALMFHILEHLDDPAAALREISLHTRRLLIEVPDFAADPLNWVRRQEGWPLWTDADHITEFTQASLEECLQAAGLDEITIVARDGGLFASASSHANA